MVVNIGRARGAAGGDVGIQAYLQQDLGELDSAKGRIRLEGATGRSGLEGEGMYVFVTESSY